MKNKASLLTGFVIGILLGAAVALIMAQPRRDELTATTGNHASMLKHSAEKPTAVNSVMCKASNGYEPPRIVLDEEQGASSSSQT